MQQRAVGRKRASETEREGELPHPPLLPTTLIGGVLFSSLEKCLKFTIPACMRALKQQQQQGKLKLSVPRCSC